MDINVDGREKEYRLLVGVGRAVRPELVGVNRHLSNATGRQVFRHITLDNSHQSSKQS